MSLIRRTPGTTWLLLVALTVVTTWVLGAGRFGSPAVPLIFALVAVKTWLVVHDFMELRDAPLLGRLVFEGWALATPAALTILAWR
jgi:hypothetical protein